ncbi:MAG: FtsH protease activity modulator HflK [Chloroflexi bacterium]|nr:FtsH protease activity modulator HflK [Chloroflexota bacterium]
MLRQAQAWTRQAQRILLAALGLGLAIWLASGIYIVQPGEQGVVLLFGRHIGTASPGINYRFPWPIQSVFIVDVQNIRRIEVGFRSANPPQSQRVLEEALMLTRDENIVEVGILVQYRVKDAAAFVFRVENPMDVILGATEVALRGVVGKMPIDAVITERRAEAQDNTRAYLEHLLDTYGAGIQVTDVRLQVADAPDQVRDAFHEVVRAREDRERKVNESQAYREDVVPRARGEAQQILQQATAYKEERIRLARGESDRFIAVLKEYQSAPEVTRERMYIEALERALSRVDKVLLPDGQNGVLPFLPLRNAPAQQTQTPAPAQPQPAPAQPQRPAQPQSQGTGR